jgi:hypothetical protein
MRLRGDEALSGETLDCWANKEDPESAEKIRAKERVERKRCAALIKLLLILNFVLVSISSDQCALGEWTGGGEWLGPSRSAAGEACVRAAFLS